MDSEFKQLAKESVIKREFLHIMIDHLTLWQIEEVYQHLKHLYFQDRF